MNIREITPQDVEAASEVCMAAFTLSVAGTVSEEGIATFATIASPDAFLNRMSRGDYLTLVAEIDGAIEFMQCIFSDFSHWKGPKNSLVF